MAGGGGRVEHPDMLTPDQLLEGLRASGAVARDARSRLAHVAGDPGRTALRAEVARMLAHSLRPTDHPVARLLLEQETAALHAIGHGESEALYVLVAVVARFARPEDALLIWRAREATPEMRAGVDVEQLARAGAGAVRRALRAMVAGGGPQAREAEAALAWLQDGLASGALDDLAGYFAWADERFGLRVSGPT